MTDEQHLTQAERRRRNASRVAYMDGVLQSLFEKDRDAFCTTAADRILLAAQDVYGKDNPATSFLRSVKDTGMSRDDIDAYFERFDKNDI